jgi:hypothetical protein
MSISGVAGAPSVPFVPQAQSVAQANPAGTSAASSPAQQIAAGTHHHRPPVNAAGPTPGAGAAPNGPATPPGSAGVNTVA